jgi:hypothetical protein
MIHYIGVVTWSENVPAEQSNIAMRDLNALAATIPGVISYHCGPNIGLVPNAGDFGVSAVFENESAWNAYDSSAEHNRIRSEVIGPYVAERRSVHFTI